MRTPVTVGVVCDESGLGAALARTFDELPQARLRWVCDKGPRVASVGYGPSTAWTTDFSELLDDEDLDAVVFASTDLAAEGRALAALAADKHVLIDGPLARRSAEAEELVAAAARRKRQLMAHTEALLRPGVTRLHRLVERGALGEIFYIHAYRYELRGDHPVDLLRELGAETIAVLLDLLRDEPVEALATGESYLDRARPDVVHAKLCFATGIDVHLHLSCLEGERTERIVVVGSAATAVLDAADPERELSLRVDGAAEGTFGELAVEQGGTIAFRLPAADCLRASCARFLTAVRSRSEVPHGREAAATLAVVEALERSCATHGSIETIAPRQEREQANVIAFRSR
jgi:predicted dehydrogenase